MTGDIIQVRFWCALGEQASANVTHFRIDAETGGGANMNEIADAMAARFAGDIKGLLSSEATFQGIEAQKIYPLPPGQAGESVVNAGLGTVVGQALPRQVCGLITFRTQYAGRSYRGRFYIPFPSEADSVTTGDPDPLYVQRANNLAASFEAQLVVTGALGTSTLRCVVWSRTLTQANLVTEAFARPAWATQRRRGEFGRPNESPFGPVGGSTLRALARQHRSSRPDTPELN